VLLSNKDYLFITLFYFVPFFHIGENVSIKRILSGAWFPRVVLISWIVSAVLILLALKNMELIVHGQLYYYGLRFSADWADPYRVCTWIIFLSLGVPAILSGVALAFSFSNGNKKSVDKRVTVDNKVTPQQAVRASPQVIVKKKPTLAENGNGGGITCPNCERVFSKALAMLDYRGGKTRLISVCPYCNYVLGNADEEKNVNGAFHVAPHENVANHSHETNRA
jgi:hypothetical protein